MERLTKTGLVNADQTALESSTERKAAEKRLAHFSAIIDSSQDAIYAATLDGVVTSWNPGAENLYGYTEKEIIGKSASVLFPPDRLHELTTFASRLLNGEPVLRYDAVRLRKDGTPVDVAITLCPLRDAGGTIIGISAIAHDITDRKRAEERLRESEARLTTIIRNAAECIYTLSLDGIITFVSPVWTRLLGHEVSEVEGQHFAPFLHPDDLPACQQAMQMLLDNGEWQSRAYRVRHKDGSWRWHRTAGSLVKDREDRPSYMIGVAEDITDLKKEQDALRRANFTLEQAGDCIIWIRPDASIAYVNQRTCEVLGFRTEELQRMTVFNIDPTMTPEQWVLHWRKIQIEKTFLIETVVRTKAGRVFPVEISVNHMDFDGNEFNCAFARDISFRKEAEKQLAHFSAIVDSSRNAIFGMTLDGVVTSWNPGAEKLYGYSAGEMIGHAADKILPLDRVDEIMKMLARLRDGGHAETYDSIRLRKDGTLIDVSVTISPIRDGTGEIIGASSIGHDITERKRAEEDLARAKQAAEAASQAKSEFLANMSHEIRTPMTAIMGFADILLESSPTEESAEWARIIKQNGDHLLSLINDILDLSKIEAGKCTVDLQECMPRKLAEEVVSLMKIRADAKGLPLTLEVRENVPETITTDQIRLRQILVNLVGNAIKFTDTGAVRVILSFTPVSATEGKLGFEVIDTGIGMTKEQMNLLFQPFSQVDGSATRRFGGSGLGLAISKRMAGMLGGDIAVDSIFGRGSTFRLTIAAGQASAPPKDRNQSTTPTAVPTEFKIVPKWNRRVLLAEDSPDIRRIIALLLRKAGAAVDVVENGQLAVDRALTAEQSSEPFDVVLMDMQMPVMDGYTATGRLREAGYVRPIIALTAHAMSGDKQECLEAGCDDYIAKPFDARTFVSNLKRLLSRQPEPPLLDLAVVR